MLCDKVSKLLSEFFDGVLDAEMSVRISQHLKQCENCREELDRLSILHDRLNSIEKTQAPDYLYHMVQLRLANKNKGTWYNRVKDALALRWSRIRTTEVQFYWTRALGTLMATLCFCFISSSVDPFQMGYPSQAARRSTISPELKKEFSMSLGEIFGRMPIEQYSRHLLIEPAIDDMYFILLGESILGAADEESFKVVTTIDSSGTAKIVNVLERPYDQSTLKNFNSVLISARCRPASINGRTISQPMVIIGSKISVYGLTL